MRHKGLRTLKIGEFEILLDEEDLERVQKYNWRILRSPSGVVSLVADLILDSKSTTIKLNRFILGAKKAQIVLFVDPVNRLNFSKSNLKFGCGRERQSQLPKRAMNTTSNYKGVILNHQTKKWRATIHVNLRAIYLGEYAIEADAARAYNKAALLYCGDHAYQNLIEENTIPKSSGNGTVEVKTS